MAIDNKQLARRYIEEVWNKGNLEVINELCDPSFEARDPVVGAYNRDHVADTVKAYRTAFPDLKLEIVSILAEGNMTAVRWIARGTNLGPFMGMPATGKSAVVSGIDLTEVRNGKVIKSTNEYDALGLMRQLGADPKNVAAPPPQQQPEATRHA